MAGAGTVQCVPGGPHVCACFLRATALGTLQAVAVPSDQGRKEGERAVLVALGVLRRPSRSSVARKRLFLKSGCLWAERAVAGGLLPMRVSCIAAGLARAREWQTC
jgi:hypothetical protein